MIKNRESISFLLKELNLSQDILDMIFSSKSMGLVYQNRDEMLSYVIDEKFVEEVNVNKSIKYVLTTKELSKLLKPKSIIVDDPSLIFWSLVEAVNRLKEYKHITQLPKCLIRGKNVSISHNGVKIGKNVFIDDNVVIKNGVEIGDNVIIGAGTVVGSEGMEIKKTYFGEIFITHDGITKIMNDVRIGALCVIHKGLMGRDTIINSYTSIDDQVHIAHGCNIGKNNIITAFSNFGGSVKTGNNVFVGLSAVLVHGISIADDVFVGAGAYVQASVYKDAKIIPIPSKIIPKN